MASIQVDGKTLPITPGQMLIEVTDAAGIYIPRFCYHEKLSVAANCRMCLVEVEKAPKPLPACATPVSDGMVVKTHSEIARDAQKGTLEFLLINHPLDCPVCDQGGECPLQDQALGYGKGASRFDENKRAVKNPDIGPLVATEMTRCIHCTRCIRFGEEIAGVMELGAPGRGEHMFIDTFLNRSVDSEVSGNIIDLCPVGALTSKPFRFSARAWELQNHRGISPHDCVGANLNIQTLRGEVERVLPRDNPAVNDCWLADRDRYSYAAMNGAHRLTKPMVKTRGEWRETDWKTALSAAAAGIKNAVGDDASQLGALASPASTLEEFFLLQKLARAFGCDNTDFRLQQRDFRDDNDAGLPCSEIPIAEFDEIKAALLIGANIRKQQPLLALRLRHATRTNAARISGVNLLDFEMNFNWHEKSVCAAHEFAPQVAAIARAAAAGAKKKLPDEIAEIAREPMFADTARALREAGAHGAVIIGANALQHSDASSLKALGEFIAACCGCRLVLLPPANSLAGHIAGCLPGERGMHAAQMLHSPRRAYLLLGAEPELDCLDGKRARDAMHAADCVVQLSAFKSDEVMQYADVLLPMAAFAETAGTYVNCELRAQTADAAAAPRDEARPGWKILRVLGNFLQLPGFDYVSLDEVRAEIAAPPAALKAARMPTWRWFAPNLSAPSRALSLCTDMPMYRGEAALRHSHALQQTADNPPPAAHVNRATADKWKLSGDWQSDDARLHIEIDARVPDDCIYIPAGFLQTLPFAGGVALAPGK